MDSRRSSRGWRSQRQKPNVNCYNCGKHGHYARECWARWVVKVRTDAEVRSPGKTKAKGRDPMMGKGEEAGSRGPKRTNDEGRVKPKTDEGRRRPKENKGRRNRRGQGPKVKKHWVEKKPSESKEAKEAEEKKIEPKAEKMVPRLEEEEFGDEWPEEDEDMLLMAQSASVEEHGSKRALKCEVWQSQRSRGRSSEEKGSGRSSRDRKEGRGGERPKPNDENRGRRGGRPKSEREESEGEMPKNLVMQLKEGVLTFEKEEKAEKVKARESPRAQKAEEGEAKSPEGGVSEIPKEEPREHRRKSFGVVEDSFGVVKDENPGRNPAR